MKFGAIHDPDSETLKSAVDFNSVRVSGVTRETNWFAAWNWAPDGDMLLNDELGCCCPVADLRLIQAWKASEGQKWRVPTELVLTRYEAIGHYERTEETDNGTVTQEDCFGWQASPIVVDGEDWRIRWLTVNPKDIYAALKRGPLLGTIALDRNADDLSTWCRDLTGSPTAYHRVVVGTAQGGLLDVMTYGRRVPVHPLRFVGVDLMLHVDQPAELRTAGVDWSAL